MPSGKELIVVPQKPMSVNKAWLGAKRKSKEYRVYEENVSSRLPDLEIPEGRLKLIVYVYYSNQRADIDNCLKPFIDILQARYSFNDCYVYELNVKKFIVNKGYERIAFSIAPSTIDWDLREKKK